MSRAAGPALAILLLAGCGVRPTGVVYAGDAPVATASGSPRSQVYLLSRGVPVPVQRTADPADPQEVFDTLLKGPTPDERAQGLTTDLTGVSRISVHELDGRALLVETIPPALKLPMPAFAQIYCTGLLLSGQTALKISYLDSGVSPYTSSCSGGKPIPATVPPSGARP
jgi:hypothetical protein